MNEICTQSAGVLADAIRRRELSAIEVVDAFLAQIRAVNPAINALVTIDEAGARHHAQRADAAVARGDRLGPLHGVPFTVKDMFETASVRTTNGHAPLANNVPKRDATVVARLKQAGAILLGKTNMPARAMDLQSDNALFGATNNPWSKERTPGGSSGGEAAAIAAAMSPLGIGGDVGGSVRIPAHYCGVYAIKPTERLVPNTGMLLPGKTNTVRHMAVTGPMASSVEDLRLALRLMAGPDGVAMDIPPATWAPQAERRPSNAYRFAYCDNFGGLPITADTLTAMERLAETLQRAGCKVEQAAPKAFDFERVWSVYGELFGIMALAEFSFPLRASVKLAGGWVFKDAISKASAKAATANPLRYFELLEEREHLAAELEAFLADYDAWICPVSVGPAFAHRAMNKIHTPIDVDGQSIPGNLAGIGYTCGFNLTGHPAVTLPAGTSKEGLPIGAQLVGRLWADSALLETAQMVDDLVGAFCRPPCAAPSIAKAG